MSTGPRSSYWTSPRQATLYGSTSIRGVIAGIGGVDVKPADFVEEVRDFVSRLRGRFEVRAPSLEEVYLEVMKGAQGA